MAQTLKDITIVPHYMRLHEWVALEEGMFEAEGLNPVLKQDLMLGALMNTDPEGGRGEQPDYGENAACSSACEWGVIRNAGAGKGKVLNELYSVAPFEIFVLPESGIESLTQLRGKPVGVMLRAGTHFTALKMLEAVMPRDQVNTVGTGGPGNRIQKLRDGEIAAACLLDPERAVAEQEGLISLAKGEFRILFYAFDGMPRELIKPYINVLKRAEKALDETPEKYLHLWDKNMNPDLRGQYDYSKFGRGERLFFETYSKEIFDDNMAYAKSWGLTPDVTNEDYSSLVEGGLN